MGTVVLDLADVEGATVDWYGGDVIMIRDTVTRDMVEGGAVDDGKFEESVLFGFCPGKVSFGKLLPVSAHSLTNPVEIFG